MKQFIYLVAFVATFALASCEKMEPTSEFQGFTFSNPQGREGTYRVTGPRGFISQGESMRTPPPGEYQVYFINQKMGLNENSCYINGYEPIFIGSTTFTVSDTNEAGAISVPIRQISSHIQFQAKTEINITAALLIGTSDHILLDGLFEDKAPIKDITRHLQDGKECDVIASDMIIQVQCQFNNRLHLFERNLKAVPGENYGVYVTKNGIDIRITK